MRTYLLFFVGLVGLVACTSSDDFPHSPAKVVHDTDIIPWDTLPPPGAGGSSGGKRDTGTADAEGDVEDDTGTAACTRTPPAWTEPLSGPCCYRDDDCRQADHPDRLLLRCYGAECTEGVSGVCRMPPTEPGRCWVDAECAPTQRCADTFASACNLAQTHDFPGMCVNR